MKKIKFALIVFVITVLGTISSFPAYSQTIVNSSFDEETAMFFYPGDINQSGSLNAEDVRDIIVILLNSSSNEYNFVTSAFSNGKCSDINGDDKVNIIDLVRLKKIIAYDLDLVEENIGKKQTKGMNLFGNTICSLNMKELLAPNKKYTIKFSYKTTSLLTVRFGKSITNDNEFTDSSSGDWKTVAHTFNTSDEFENSNGYEFAIVGNGVIDDIYIYEVGSDNAISFVW